MNQTVQLSSLLINFLLITCIRFCKNSKNFKIYSNLISLSILVTLAIIKPKQNIYSINYDESNSRHVSSAERNRAIDFHTFVF